MLDVEVSSYDSGLSWLGLLGSRNTVATLHSQPYPILKFQLNNLPKIMFYFLRPSPFEAQVALNVCVGLRTALINYQIFSNTQFSCKYWLSVTLFLILRQKGGRPKFLIKIMIWRIKVSLYFIKELEWGWKLRWIHFHSSLSWRPELFLSHDVLQVNVLPFDEQFTELTKRKSLGLMKKIAEPLLFLLSFSKI